MDTNQTLNHLRAHGYAIIEQFAGALLPQLVSEFDQAFSLIPDKTQAYLNDPAGIKLDGPGSYNPGKHLRVQPGAYGFFPQLTGLFLTEQFRSIVNNYCGPTQHHAIQIFMSHEYNICEDKNSWNRLNWLHWDPYPSLKFLFYLMDTDETNGASGFVPGSRSLGKFYREKCMDLKEGTGWEGGCRHRLEDWEENPKYTNADAQPVRVKAGGLLILDTDVLHCGGLIKQLGKERRIVIVHNRPQENVMPLYDPPYEIAHSTNSVEAGMPG